MTMCKRTLLARSVPVILAAGMLLAGGCSSETGKTEATPAAATGAVAPANSAPGAPPPGAVAGGGVGERINK